MTQGLFIWTRDSELPRGNECPGASVTSRSHDDLLSRRKFIVIWSLRIYLNSFSFYTNCYREWILNTFTYFWCFLELFSGKFISNINNEHAHDYSCPGATFAFCSRREKLPRQGGLPGVVQRVMRLSKLPRGNEKLMWTVKPGFHLDIFLPFVARFGFWYQRKATTSNAILKWEHPQKNKTSNKKLNEQQIAFACFGFWDRIDSISKTRKSNEGQWKATNGRWKHAPKPKTSNRKQQRAFFIPIFIDSRQFWTCGRWLISRAMKSQKEQRWATKSNEKQQKATKSNTKQQRTSELENQNGQEKAKTSNERHKKPKWKPSFTGVRSYTEAKLTPGSMSCPGQWVVPGSYE